MLTLEKASVGSLLHERLTLIIQPIGWVRRFPTAHPNQTDMPDPVEDPLRLDLLELEPLDEVMQRLKRLGCAHRVFNAMQDIIDDALSRPSAPEQVEDGDDDTDAGSPLLFDSLTEDSLQHVLRMASKHPFSTEWSRSVELDTVERLLQVPGCMKKAVGRTFVELGIPGGYFNGDRLRGELYDSDWESDNRFVVWNKEKDILRVSESVLQKMATLSVVSTCACCQGSSR